jgi:hypothetical protein
VNCNSPIDFLPRWDAKTIKYVGVDAGDASSRKQTRSQKKHVSDSLMMRALETYDRIFYSDVEG